VRNCDPKGEADTVEGKVLLNAGRILVRNDRANIVRRNMDSMDVNAGALRQSIVIELQLGVVKQSGLESHLDE
jgi:hypothetical protein